jgi:hypothetical protein
MVFGLLWPWLEVLPHQNLIHHSILVGLNELIAVVGQFSPFLRDG